MADYRDHYQQIRATGATLAAVSVDALNTSESLRRDLSLPFPILCDTDRHIVREWDIFNPHEKGGIAKPAAFVVNRDRTVRYATVDGVATRVPASAMLLLLQSIGDSRRVRRSIYLPRLGEWIRGMRNLFKSRP